MYRTVILPFMYIVYSIYSSLLSVLTLWCGDCILLRETLFCVSITHRDAGILTVLDLDTTPDVSHQ